MIEFERIHFDHLAARRPLVSRCIRCGCIIDDGFYCDNCLGFIGMDERAINARHDKQQTKMAAWGV